MVNRLGLDTEKRLALDQQIRDEWVEIRLLKIPLRWRADYRQIMNWRKALTKREIPYTMIDTRNGEVMVFDKSIEV